MLEQIIFRRVVSQDYCLLEAMVSAFYAEEQLPFQAEQLRNTLQRFEKYPENGKVWIFEYQNMLVGYAIVVKFWSNEYGGFIWVIDELFVVEAMRGRGIAQTFFSFLEKMPTTDVVGLALEVQKHNEKALRLYQKVGFELTGRHHLKKIF